MLRIVSYSVVVLSVFLIGCASTVKNPTVIADGIENYSAPKDMGSIYLYRNQFSASAASLKWQLDNSETGFLPGHSNVRFDVPHGLHKIKAAIHSSKPSEIAIDVVAGQKYFVKHEIKYLYSYSLLEPPKEIALQEISKTQSVKPVLAKVSSIQKQSAVSVDKALIMIYNDSNIANRVSISINKSPVAALRSGDYIRISVAPGSYEVISDGGTANLKVEAEAGQTHYIRQDVSLFGGRKLGLFPGVKLHLSSEDSFSKFSKNLPTHYANIDLTSEPPIPFYLEDGAIYQGEFINGYPNGKGKIIYPDGQSKISSYEGDVKYGRMNGVGTIVQRDGIIYTGNVQNGMANGKGVYKFLNGNVWESNFKNNIASGQSIATFADGGKYEGNLLNWKFDGKGQLTTNNGVANGIFKKGKFYSGQIFNNQEQLVAQYQNGNKIERQVNQQQSENNLIADILNFGISATSIIVQSYNRSASSKLNAQRDLLGDLDSDIPAPIPVRAVGKSTNKSNDDYYVNSTSSKSLATDSTVSKSGYNAISSGCTSDFQCGVGNSCVKQRYSNDGVCMKSVDSNGTRVYNMPNSNSIGVRTSEGCQFNTDCPVGFSCDATYKACVRK